jgi:hypothetical protein
MSETELGVANAGLAPSDPLKVKRRLRGFSRRRRGAGCGDLEAWIGAT